MTTSTRCRNCGTRMSGVVRQCAECGGEHMERWVTHEALPMREPVPPKCSCQWEIGDSQCEKHPTCETCEMVMPIGSPHECTGAVWSPMREGIPYQAGQLAATAPANPWTELQSSAEAARGGEAAVIPRERSRVPWGCYCGRCEEFDRGLYQRCPGPGLALRMRWRREVARP